MAFKRINKNGTITIPKNVRTQAGLFAGRGVEMCNNPDGSITIRPSAPCCRFCGSPEKVIIVDEIKICMKCARKVLSEVDITNE